MTFARVPAPYPLGQVDFESATFRRWLDGQRQARADLDLARRPLVLIGANSVLAREFAEGCKTRLNVVAVVDNALPADLRAQPMVIGDADIDGVLGAFPDAIGVMCCASERAIDHFTTLWGNRPQPLLFYFEVISALPDLPAGANLGFIPGFEVLETAQAVRRAASRYLRDPQSLAVLDAILLHRLTWDVGCLKPVRRPEKAIYYERDVLPLSESEVFIDGGAYNGDSALEFIRQVDGRYREIHAFEIDPANSAAFRDNVTDPRARIHTLGLWSEAGQMRLAVQDEKSSRLSAEGELVVDLVALDDMDLPPPTLIKLDIEGAEVPALKGAARTIAGARPRLAVCAYHKADDLVTLFDTVAQIRSDYRFQLRHYSPVVFDSVIYMT